MVNKILIDAAHEEETRAVVVSNERIEEFDFEATGRKRLRGNIYLAKVTRVEPSLQAAFVDYGGNRHGFLAFGETHPDYYQIPLADRQALMREAAEELSEDEGATSATEHGHSNSGHAQRHLNDSENKVVGPLEADAGVRTENDASKDILNDMPHIEHGIPAELSGQIVDMPVENSNVEESVGAVDALEEVPLRKVSRNRQKYKIQEVIKRGQILLVQIMKEERGNKGAAVTTYLSIAGRYCVLMPNTSRSGGISRKITNQSDRRKLKAVADELQPQLQDGMGVILRTAGATRTKIEIKRDFEYLLRLWETVRDLTLQSTAPVLVYEEGSLVKRLIRDLYSKDFSEILISGEQAYREAKAFMRMLMPSHAKFVRAYKEKKPIFSNYGVETQLDAMFSSQVMLQSGGHIVINQTEALVAIDVNSGRSTREHDIEDTALSTNIEAAMEIARQLRLRDLAGLIVVDFIDMEEKRNQRLVERKMKECLRSDRARIQVGMISHFGLLEMSRQRMRMSMLEGSTIPCTHCHGSGSLRSTESIALNLLRSIEDILLDKEPDHITARIDSCAAFYVLNRKRTNLRLFEEQFGVTIVVEADDTLAGIAPVLEYKKSKQRAASQDDSNDASKSPGTILESDKKNTLTASVETPGSKQAPPVHNYRNQPKQRHVSDTVDKVQNEDKTTAIKDGVEQKQTHANTESNLPETGVPKPGARKRRRGQRRNKTRESTQTTVNGDTVACSGDNNGNTASQPEPSSSGKEAKTMIDSGVKIIPDQQATAMTKIPQNDSKTPHHAEKQGMNDVVVEADTTSVPFQQNISSTVNNDNDASLADQAPKRGGWWRERFRNR